MSDISRINRLQPTKTTEAKKYKQDAPVKGEVYSNVFRSEGKAEETIQAILYFAKKKIGEKEEKGQQGKKQQQQGKKKQKEEENKYDENKVYVISSPVAETMVQPRQNGCAPTCLAMLLRKYNLVKNVKEGYQKVETLRGKDSKFLNDVGMSLEDISTHAQTLGLKSRVQRGENFIFQLEGLLRSLNIGATPIASIQLPGMGTMRHAVLIIGISNHKVTIIDPAEIEVKDMTIEEFQKAWGKQSSSSYGVGLAYVEVWGPKPSGEVKEYMDWMSVFEEFTKDKLSINSMYYKRSDIVPVITLFPDF
ncbi:MAG: cysteine peptidase family C39 domain-containing protein [Candidatus Sericytochromatia bacterium]